MSNFVKKIAARESVEGSTGDASLEVELPQDNTEGLLSEISSDTQDIELLDKDGEQLEEDTVLVEGQLDNVDDAIAVAGGEEPSEDAVITEADEDMSDAAAANIDAVTESVRRRWNITTPNVATEAYGRTNRRMAARESLWTTLKELIKRFIAWIKEQGRKVKDRWLKFSNAGKSMVKRAAKYDALLKKCKTKDKDDISGAFIKQLSVGKEFRGNEKAIYDKVVELVKSKTKAQTDIIDNAIKACDRLANVNDAKNQAVITTATNLLETELEKKMAEFAKGGVAEEVLGGKAYKVEHKDGDISIEFVDTDASIESDVPTPSTAQISTLIGSYKKLGAEVEKTALAYRAVDSARDKLNKALDKVETALDKMDSKSDENISYSELTRAFRKSLSFTRTTVSNADTINSYSVQSACAGLNGYIVASIAAYKKK